MLTACILLAVYLILTLVTPRILSSRRLLIEHPALLIGLWLGALGLAALSLLSALGILIARALRHHITHVEGHDVAGPLVDSLLGWMSIAFIGLIAFRLGVAAHETRTKSREISELLAPVIASAEPVVVGDRTIWRVDSAQPLAVALPQARRVVITTAMLNRLAPTNLAAVVEHESSHLRHHHERVLTIGGLAEAVAPAFLAGSRLAQSCRIATELIADDDAVAACGIEATADALEAAYPADPGVTERVRRLRTRLSTR